MSKEEVIVFQPATESVFKVIVVGDPSVGKSSLLLKFSSKKFKEQYIPTVGVNITKEQVTLDDNGEKVLINLMLWDVAGQLVEQLA